MAKRIRLDPKLDTAAAKELAATLLDAEGEDAVLGGEAVEMIGGLCLELILTARHHWDEAGQTLTLDDPSAAMVENLRQFGLGPDLTAIDEAAA